MPHACTYLTICAARRYAGVPPPPTTLSPVIAVVSIIAPVPLCSLPCPVDPLRLYCCSLLSRLVLALLVIVILAALAALFVRRSPRRAARALLRKHYIIHLHTDCTSDSSIPLINRLRTIRVFRTVLYAKYNRP